MSFLWTIQSTNPHQRSVRTWCASEILFLRSNFSQYDTENMLASQIKNRKIVCYALKFLLRTGVSTEYTDPSKEHNIPCSHKISSGLMAGLSCNLNAGTECSVWEEQWPSANGSIMALKGTTDKWGSDGESLLIQYWQTNLDTPYYWSLCLLLLDFTSLKIPPSNGGIVTWW